MSCSSKYQQLKEYIKSKRDAYQDLLDHIDKLDGPEVSDFINFTDDIDFDLGSAVSAEFPTGNVYAADTVSLDLFGSGQDRISFDIEDPISSSSKANYSWLD